MDGGEYIYIKQQRSDLKVKIIHFACRIKSLESK